jgi:hypothetical protein
MRALFIIVFVMVFFVPGLFLIYGPIYSVILLVLGDYTRFVGVAFGMIAGGLGFFSAVQLLGHFLDDNTKIMRALWLKCFLFFGFFSIVFVLANSPDTLNIPITISLILPIPFVLYLMYLNRLYLWKSANKKINKD